MFQCIHNKARQIRGPLPYPDRLAIAWAHWDTHRRGMKLNTYVKKFMKHLPEWQAAKVGWYTPLPPACSAALSLPPPPASSAALTLPPLPPSLWHLHRHLKKGERLDDTGNVIRAPQAIEETQPGLH
jgi:hypothetical protein